jgi:type II secretory pathway component PulM
MPTLVELQTELDNVRREVRNLTVMGMDPKQTPEQAELIKALERSARAEGRLRKMALEHAKGELRRRGRQRRKSAVQLTRSPIVR